MDFCSGDVVMLDFKQQIQLDTFADCYRAQLYSLDEALKRAYDLGRKSCKEQFKELLEDDK